MMFHNQFRRPSQKVILVGSVFFLLLVAIISVGFLFRVVEGQGLPFGVRSVSGDLAHIVLKRTYLTGETEVETREEVIGSSDELQERYEGWTLTNKKGNEYTFETRINDISPACKNNGYFGINEKGELSLFEGVPEKEKVIQTFFRLDTEKIESHLPNEELTMLKRGIRVKDVVEYNSVLSTFSEFANYEKASTIKVK